MRLTRIAAAVTAIPLLVAACSSSPATSTPSGTPANPDAGLLTGSQLDAMLAPASWFPAGYTADPSGSENTGSTYEPPTTSANLPCSRLDGTSWIELARVGSVSFAQNDYIDNDTSEEYAQEIDVFQGAGAQQVMAALRKLPGTCPTFTDPQTKGTVTVRLQSGPSLGDDALTFLLSSPAWNGGTALEAVRVGTAVVTVLHSADSGTGAAQTTSLATLLATNVKSKIKS
jgi:hypothetical protein